MKDIACSDCVVTMLLGPVEGGLESRKDMFDVLAGSGLVPPLRLVSSQQFTQHEDSTGTATG